MVIHTAEFLISNTDIARCPAPDKPEYAFIGRSNVGKSSLINMVCDHSKLAKTSQTPGKTQLINHFVINDEIYFVDLPGFGFAKSSKQSRNVWSKFTHQFLKTRENLLCTFVLIDSRLKPQKIDMEFMQWMGLNRLPFIIIFTKIDKLSSSVMNKNITHYKKELLKTWEELPPSILTSSTTKFGKEEFWKFIEETNKSFV
ncbi:ribosome biogenesis GTP-binding protein YihA/YsxC [Vicingaceae bacterium]|nr:ribosome biogenesis GTP-binding protein YihA/YsxC [Vicingaceae bacterium]